MTTTKDADLLVKLAAHLGNHIEGAESLIKGLREVVDRTQNPGMSTDRPEERVWTECNDFCLKAEAVLRAWQTKSDFLRVLIRLQSEASYRDKKDGGST
ncbi:MAG: hypothetical protein WC372_12365 [Candidatus Neomarinimicrobiota bacterium]|jgi:hypothetical protein